MKEMFLTKGQIALIDDEDFEKLSQWSWYAHSNPVSNTSYAARGTFINYKNKLYLMHRQILGITDPKISVDHADGNGLNNQKSNLRICTHSQNMCNTSKRKNTTSRFKGVSWCSDRNKWEVEVRVDNKRLRVGRYENEIEAALAYNVTASFAHREFARLNVV